MQKIYPEGTLSDVFILNILLPQPLAAKGSGDTSLFQLPFVERIPGVHGPFPQTQKLLPRGEGSILPSGQGTPCFAEVPAPD